MTRSKQTVIALTALAAAISGALAQEVPGVTGSVSIGGISSNVDSQNPFRFDEYRDLSNGATGGFDLRTTGAGPWWFKGFGENIGRDDQFIEFKGGNSGVFKFQLYNDDIIHNTTHNALTPFTGIGTNNITFTGPSAPTNVSTWNRFDYSVKHRNYGGFAEGQATPDSPLYFRIDAKEKHSEGIRTLGAAGTSPGGPAYELPAPIDWKTTDISGEIGYSTRKMHLSVSYLYSKFEDDNEFLSWRTPQVTSGPNVEHSTIAMDNKLERWAANAIFRQLPWDSTLALRAVHTKVTNDFPIFPTFLSVSGTTGFDRLAGASSPNFSGEVVNESFSAAFNSRLAKGWDSKVYYNYYKRENNSSEIVFTPSGGGSGGTCDVNANGATLTTCSTEFLHFKKQNAGVELYYRVNPSNRLAIGYDYLDTERERLDFNENKEQKGWLEWKSGSLEYADLRVKYYHLNRTGTFLLGGSTVVFDRLVYRFDAAPLDRDVIKFTIEGSPMPLLDLGAEFIYKKNKYGDTVFGRTKDTRQEVSLSGSWGDAKVFRVTAFADWEHTQYDSSHWVGSTASYPVPIPPGSQCSSGCYPWSSEAKDKNYLFGVAADWPVNPRLRFYGSYIWTKADGSVDFEAPAFANAQPIRDYDNYKKQTLNLKGVWAATKQFDVTLGYAYEKYDYSDIQLNDYIYNIKTGSNQNFFSGAYAFPNYRANVVYGWLTYRF